MVSDAARAGIEVLPVLVDKVWRRGAYRSRVPRRPRARRRFAAWAQRVVARYGAAGSFWRERPQLPYVPFRAYQIWNEPNLTAHWPRPSPRRYVALLRASTPAIKAVDPAAQIVAGGFPDTTRGTRLRPYLRGFYRQPGVRKLFDALAVHPYARNVWQVEDLLFMVRRMMRRNGDGGRPLWITEIGWATDGPYRSRFRVGTRGQARRLDDTFQLLLEQRRRWRIERVFWFSFKDRSLLRREQDWWGPHTGLFYVSGYAKPAWGELTRLAGGEGDDWLGRPYQPDPEPEPEPPCNLGVFCP